MGSASPWTFAWSGTMRHGTVSAGLLLGHSGSRSSSKVAGTVRICRFWVSILWKMKTCHIKEYTMKTKWWYTITYIILYNYVFSHIYIYIYIYYPVIYINHLYIYIIDIIYIKYIYILLSDIYYYYYYYYYIYIYIIYIII